MKKLQLKKFGKDKWSRMVYGDKAGNLFKDVSCGMGEPVFCTSYGGFDGEPDTPIEYIKKYENVEIEIVSEFPNEEESID